MRNLDMTTLRAFLTVAEQGGVTRAAAALHLTQSAVSMQLKRLEESLGLDLLDRSNRRIALTPSGEQLLAYARRLVALNDEAVGRLTDQVYEGVVTLGVPHDIVFPVLPKVLKTFNSAFPRVQVHLKSNGTVRLHEALQKGEADLILTTEGMLRPGGETLTQMALRWIRARNGYARQNRPLQLAFCSCCIFRPLALKALDEAGIEWKMMVESEDDRAVEALLSADLAIGAMLEDGLPSHLDVIPLGEGLPDLGVQQINLYGGGGQDEVVAALAAMLRQGYAAVGRPALAKAGGGQLAR